MTNAMSLERLWAGWRADYVATAAVDAGPEDDVDGCVLCRLVATDDDATALVLERSPGTITVMNLYPYASGHLMIAPTRHVAELDALTDDETVAVAYAQQRAIRALRAVYSPEGLNVGANLGRAAGAGVPGHLHVHVVPRWSGDTNFMTAIAEARVMPESLRIGYDRLRAAWPR